MSYCRSSLAVRFLLQVPAHSRQNKTSSQSVNMRAMATTHGVVREWVARRLVAGHKQKPVADVAIVCETGK